MTPPRYLRRRTVRRRGSQARTTGQSTPPWARPSRRPGSARWRWRSQRSSGRARSPSDPLASRKPQLQCPRFWESELLSPHLDWLVQERFSLQALTIATLYEWVSCAEATRQPGQDTFSAPRACETSPMNAPTTKSRPKVPLCQSPLSNQTPLFRFAKTFLNSVSQPWEILVKPLLIKLAPKKVQ